MTVDQTRVRPATWGDAADILEFEQANRAWFRGHVPDRGDAYFDRFDDLYGALLAEQDRGESLFGLVHDVHGTLVGRVNLTDIGPTSASLGYRIGRDHTRRGHARRAVVLMTERARALGLREVVALTTVTNVASQRTLLGAGFAEVPGAQTLRHRGESVAAVQFRITLA